MITSVRNLTRSFLACSSLPSTSSAHPVASPAETDKVIRILIAILYATKHHLRASWGADNLLPRHLSVTTAIDEDQDKEPPETITDNRDIIPAEYADLLPPSFRPLTEYSSFHPASSSVSGASVGLPLQLTYPIETYIKRYTDTGAFSAPQASQLTVQLNTLVGAYSSAETIRLTGVPVAILIHQKQVLALFGCVLPFALVDEMGWWSVAMVSLVCFALYGIDGIARQLEDPFGYDKNDIKVDGLVEDVREEVVGLLEEWRGVVGWPDGKGWQAQSSPRDDQQQQQQKKKTEMFMAPESSNSISAIDSSTIKTGSAENGNRNGMRARFTDDVAP